MGRSSVTGRRRRFANTRGAASRTTSPDGAAGRCWKLRVWRSRRGSNYRRGIAERTERGVDAGPADGTSGLPTAWDRERARRGRGTGSTLAGRERPTQRLLRVEQGERPVAPGVRLRGGTGPQPRASAPDVLRPRIIASRRATSARSAPRTRATRGSVQALKPPYRRTGGSCRARRVRGGDACIALPFINPSAAGDKTRGRRSDPATRPDA